MRTCSRKYGVADLDLSVTYVLSICTSIIPMWSRVKMLALERGVGADSACERGKTRAHVVARLFPPIARASVLTRVGGTARETALS